MFYYIFYYNKNNEVRIKCFKNDLVATEEFVKKIRTEGVISLKVKESLDGLYYLKMNPVSTKCIGIIPPTGFIFK